MDFIETFRSVAGFNKAKREPEKPLLKETQHILPESVRYALEHRKGQLGIEEIISLAHDSYFKNGAMYLALKWLDGNPSQFNLFSDIVKSLDAKTGEQQKPLPEIILPYLKEASERKSVESKKLAQYSRQTPEVFNEGFTRIAESAFSQNSLPVLVTNAGFLGLPSLMKSARNHQQNFGILHDSPLINEEKISGYTVSFANNKLEIQNSLSPALAGAKHVTLIDDAIHTEDTKMKILSGWNKQNEALPVDFQAVATAPSQALV